ncbi:MAG TPA: TspO/MBR family protein [Hyphomicrobium sp.]|nr:TspO/MBR family protein [Hyphomicrobium sp.]
MTKYSGLLVFLLLVAGAAYTGITYLPGPFYAVLEKPTWTPPNEVFPPVWAALYVLIAIAGWIAWRAQGFGPLLWLWLLQLCLNGAWSYLMFGEKQITYALADIAALWLAILAFILVAWPVRRSAALLFVPYLLWVSYAAALNFELWRLNG